MLNELAQQDFRALLFRLRSSQAHEPATLTPTRRIAQGMDSLVASAAAAGYTVCVDVVEVPDSLSFERTTQILAIARELVTNIVKHSSRLNESAISFCLEQSKGEPELVIVAENEVQADVLPIPGSLSIRSEALGGSCEALIRRGRLTVTIAVPLVN